MRKLHGQQKRLFATIIEETLNSVNNFCKLHILKQTINHHFLTAFCVTIFNPRHKTNFNNIMLVDINNKLKINVIDIS